MPNQVILHIFEKGCKAFRSFFKLRHLRFSYEIIRFSAIRYLSPSPQEGKCHFPLHNLWFIITIDINQRKLGVNTCQKRNFVNLLKAFVIKF
jgi:hypothetical protein